MSIGVGGTVGAYEITALLGEGGMGRVFRARDTRLKRDVAIKALPDAFAVDAERVARLQIEAEALAALNHPHIAGIHDLLEAGASRFLVLELVEGETLAERLTRGALPVPLAIGAAIQIADALEAAHARGIVHRDLKPSNIKITRGDLVKVLDFGLAKVLTASAAGHPSSLTHSPTVVGGTMAGVVLGTAAYMSPEQANGMEPSAAWDVWAFGCVLYEMLAGRPVFEGRSAAEILAGVFKQEPDWSRLPPDTPPAIRRLLRRCLRKDQRQRLKNIGDARIELEEAKTEPAAAEALPAGDRSRRSTRWPWFVTAAAVILSAVAIATTLRRTVIAPEMRLEITTSSSSDRQALAISPDGRTIVFVAASQGRDQLWARPIDAAVAHPLGDTDGATYPFWSPNSDTIAFFADGKLKRIGAAGGAVQIVADAPSGRGGTWNREDVILFAPAPGSALFRVAASGGTAQPATRMENNRQGSHRFPQFLPDQKHFIFYSQGSPDHRGLHVGALGESGVTRLLDIEAAAVFAAPGHLLFPQQGTLVAQAFDADRRQLMGESFPVAAEVVADATVNSSAISASTTGTVVYRAGSPAEQQLVWFDRSGRQVAVISGLDGSSPFNPAVSPDGRRVALDRVVKGNRDIWLVETARGTLTRLTFDGTSDFFPIWSRDGSRIFFTSLRDGSGLYERPSGGTGGDRMLFNSQTAKATQDVSPDGRFLLFRTLNSPTGWDLFAAPLDGQGAPVRIATTPFEEREGQFSADSQWVAFASNESGRSEVYVQPFPSAGAKWQISIDGGTQPRWRRDTRELFFIGLDRRLMSVVVNPVAPGQPFDAGKPNPLFATRIAGGPTPAASNSHQYAVSDDGNRFLINTLRDDPVSPPIAVILNWRPSMTK